MTFVRRHDQQRFVRSRVQNPRRISREQLKRNQLAADQRAKDLAEQVALEAEIQAQAEAARARHTPAITTKQGLIDAGLLTTKK